MDLFPNRHWALQFHQSVEKSGHYSLQLAHILKQNNAPSTTLHANTKPYFPVPSYSSTTLSFLWFMRSNAKPTVTTLILNDSPIVTVNSSQGLLCNLWQPHTFAVTKPASETSRQLRNALSFPRKHRLYMAPPNLNASVKKWHVWSHISIRTTRKTTRG